MGEPCHSAASVVLVVCPRPRRGLVAIIVSARIWSQVGRRLCEGSFEEPPLLVVGVVELLTGSVSAAVQLAEGPKRMSTLS